jgi:hypothetical protein
VTTALASAADARYGNWLLNLLASVRRRSDIFDRLVAYDLGLTHFQRRLLDGMPGVEVRTVPPFSPQWRQGRTWKTWIWTHLEADTVVWLDAGITVLRPLSDFLDQAADRGYFVVSQGHLAGDSIPSDFYELYDLPPDFGEHVSIASGILAFRRDAPFYARVIVPTYEDALAGRSLGFSAGEVENLNRGLDTLDHVIVRDCPLFRHEQTLLTIHFYRSTTRPYVNDVYKYGGWMSPHDHPEQVIWSHRRRGDFRFLLRAPYQARTALVGLPWGAVTYLRAYAQRQRRFLRPAVYAHLARRVLSTSRHRSRRLVARRFPPT